MGVTEVVILQLQLPLITFEPKFSGSFRIESVEYLHLYRYYTSLIAYIKPR